MTTQYVYDENGYFTGIYEGPSAQANSTLLPPIYLNGRRPRFIEGAWESSIKVSPVEFKLLFTTAERIALKAARSTDPLIEEFFDVLEDPRLTFVNLGLESTRNSLAYIASKGLIKADRPEQILSGVLQ